jgi:hypothetical protein
VPAACLRAAAAWVEWISKSNSSELNKRKARQKCRAFFASYAKPGSKFGTSKKATAEKRNEFSSWISVRTTPCAISEIQHFAAGWRFSNAIGLDVLILPFAQGSFPSIY